MNNYSKATRMNYIRRKRRKRIRRMLLLVILISLTLSVKCQESHYKNSHELDASANTKTSTDRNEKKLEESKASIEYLFKDEDQIPQKEKPIVPEEKENNTTPNSDANNNNSDSSQKIEETTTDEYDYTKPVPLSETVEESYFDDAVFIGDSRTEGFMLYSPPSKALSYTYKGLMVDTVFTSEVIKKDGNKIPVMEAIEDAHFNKIYIMLGINETGWVSTDTFIEKYEKIIDSIRESHPDADIYIQSILPVSHKVSSRHSYIKNSKINEYNSRLLGMARDNGVYFIDVAEAVTNENGCLPNEAAADGIHLKKPYCQKWLEYLKTHTIK
ncbi:hypothetical protein AN1V17_00640 [Vallitalea sediminicola]